MRILALVLLFLNPMGFAAEQTPPLAADSGEACHIADAKPLLDPVQYKGTSGYNVKTVAKSPLVLQESIKLDEGAGLKIEERGCEDIYFKFKHQLKATSAQTNVERVNATADVLASLKLSKDALINEKQIQEIVTKVKAQALKEKKQKEFTVCLMKVSSECITDVKVTIHPSEVEFYYIDRP